MRFFPRLTEEFHSPLPPAELLRLVQANTAPPLTWHGMWAGQPTAHFRGRVGGEGFDISRIISGRNSMLPRIEAWVSAGRTGGSQLRLRHSLPPFTLGFAAVWLLGVGSVAVAALGAGLTGQGKAGLEGPFGVALAPLGMLAFGLLLFTVPFWLEVAKSRPLLLTLLQLELAGPA